MSSDIPPSKRRRLYDNTQDPVPPGSSAGSQPVPLQSIKTEHSPPPLRLVRRLVTSGAKRFFPLPANCHPSCPEFRNNRKKWTAGCVKELRALDLRIHRTMIRDDGLVVDWSSAVPVWADTLQPGPCDLAATITQTHKTNARARTPCSDIDFPAASQIRRSTSPGSIGNGINRAAGYTSPFSISQPIAGPSTPGRIITPPSGNNSISNPNTPKAIYPAPPRPSSIRRAIAAKLVNTSSPSPSGSSQSPVHPIPRPSLVDDDDIVILDGPPTAPSSSTTAPETTMPSEPITQCASRAEQEMSEMTLNYLRRYVQTYEADRASLASAYSRFASFSFRSHRHQHVSDGTAGVAAWIPVGDPIGYSGLKQGRLDITTTLVMLPSLHEPSEQENTHSNRGGVGQLGYDILYLGAQVGTFVVCQAVMPQRTVVHSFMLQRREVDKEEADVEGVWPLVANVHQMVVFEG